MWLLAGLAATDCTARLDEQQETIRQQARALDLLERRILTLEARGEHRVEPEAPRTDRRLSENSGDANIRLAAETASISFGDAVPLATFADSRVTLSCDVFLAPLNATLCQTLAQLATDPPPSPPPIASCDVQLGDPINANLCEELTRIASLVVAITPPPAPPPYLPMALASVVVVFDTIGAHTWTAPTGILDDFELQEMLVIGGGGGGEDYGRDGAGGAGLLIEYKRGISGDGSAFVLQEGPYTITVADVRAFGYIAGGLESSFATAVVAPGGGGGGHYSSGGGENGHAGGSGGGGSGTGSGSAGSGGIATQSASAFPTSMSAYGHNGGSGTAHNSQGGFGGGGGGAGGPGGNGVGAGGTGQQGANGAGRMSDITGTSVEYAQGGGPDNYGEMQSPTLPYGSGGGTFTNGQQGAVILRYTITQSPDSPTHIVV